jgi:hypothetical protein
MSGLTVTPRPLGPSRQLTAATLAAGRSQPWLADPNGRASPIERIVIQLDVASAVGTYVEYGGADVTAGNGLQLLPGDAADVNATNAASIWVVPSVAGLVLRGQIQ